MSTTEFHPLIAEWFSHTFGEPTEPQRRGWPLIAAGRHTLIAAPTGSGKTLSAFLVCIDRLFRRWREGHLEDRTYVVYVSPLKALSNDIERNLRRPLEEISTLAAEAGLGTPQIRVGVRTGDTPASQRAAMLRRPPHILVTTPESLYLLVTSRKGREILRGAETVIVDEIHALARDKRGSHLTLTLERLAALCETPPIRIGLSATQRPMEEIAEFLVGAGSAEVVRAIEGSHVECGVRSAELPATNSAPHSEIRIPKSAIATRQGALFEPALERTLAAATLAVADPLAECAPSWVGECALIDVGHVRELDLAIEVPPARLEAVCSNEQWAEIYEMLVGQITSHRSTLVFVNTRALAERVAHHLTELLGEEAVASHHGSLSREIRLDAEQRLKEGKLRAIVATASLEMGIDVGYIDLVVQLGSPRAIATFLQRVGRAGHHLAAIPKGRLLPMTRDELMECLALMRAVRRGELDRIEIQHQPLDILAQQLIATVACDDWHEDDLYQLVRRAYPYRNLARETFDETLKLVCEGITSRSKRGAYLYRDALTGRLKARRGARIAAITSGGAIPEKAEYRVVALPDRTFVGSVDEDFAIDSSAGDIFLLGNTSWRIQAIRGGEVIVQDAEGAPPTIPFWFGEAPGRTIELSYEISLLREELAERTADIWREIATEADQSALGSSTLLDKPAVAHDLPTPLTTCNLQPATAPAAWLMTECNASRWGAEQAVKYVAAQMAAMGTVPTARRIVFERFFDESGGMQLVVHAPLGARITRAWGLAFRKRFCRSFDFELQAAADDDGLLLSLGPQHSFPLESLFSMLGRHNGRKMLEQALLAVPMFQVRWRWNVTRALAVLRWNKGKKVPPFLQKFQAEDLLAACFPETVGCLENHHGDVEIPDHPLVRQTMHDCLHEAMDLDRWLAVLDRYHAGEIEFIACDTREPSPFSHELINSNPYAFLDGAPLEERRTRAVTLRRGLSVDELRDLGRLDADAIRQVAAEAWPLARDPDELHDALLSLGALAEHEEPGWHDLLAQLARAGRATLICRDDAPRLWIAAERTPTWEAILDSLADQAAGRSFEPEIVLPPHLAARPESSAAMVDLIRGRMTHSGPTTAADLGTLLGLPPERVGAALEALEGEGAVLRGHFTAPKGETVDTEWCDRRLLARIHRLTLGGLRKRIQPVDPHDYVRYLVRHQRALPERQCDGANGVREAVAQLQGFEAAAGAWERALLAARLRDYDPDWLDDLFLSGEITWGRLRSPARKEDSGPSGAGMTRSAPIALLLREDLPWLLPRSNEPHKGLKNGSRNGTAKGKGNGHGSGNANGHAHGAAEEGDGQPGDSLLPPLRSNAQQVLEVLRARGALFLQELRGATGLLGGHLEEALRELAALGLVNCDGFSAVRAIVAGQGEKRPARGRRPPIVRSRAPAGRWSLFPGPIVAPNKGEHLERWCRQLLARYGVLFRDLLARESAAPPWYELVPVLRRLERRGEIRGGRFVAGVGGEQYALESAVEQLRAVRDDADPEPWIVLSAVDPLNLSGIITVEGKIPAMHRNAFILQRGRVVATRIAGQVVFHVQEIDDATRHDMERALRTGRKSEAATHIRRIPREGHSSSNVAH